ncbi:hypothetical protein, partial [Alcanivorax sp.]|uniref:hypothetical protein n=1 Tax=Alcanivorax sp. TaxID=1872427 RepID=UPI0025B92AAC
KLQATSYKLQATSYKLQATSYDWIGRNGKVPGWTLFPFQAWKRGLGRVRFALRQLVLQLAA